MKFVKICLSYYTEKGRNLMLSVKFLRKWWNKENNVERCIDLLVSDFRFLIFI